MCENIKNAFNEQTNRKGRKKGEVENIEKDKKEKLKNI